MKKTLLHFFKKNFYLLSILLSSFFLTACISQISAPVDSIINASSTSGTVSSAKTDRTIAVLLPLSGNFSLEGKTIRSAIEAGANAQNNDMTHHIKFIYFDSEHYTDGKSAYQAALVEQPSLILGPLTKNAVNSIVQEDLPIPTLALNQAEQTMVTPINLYAFSLNPQADAIAVAEKIDQDGYQQVITIAPNDQWGNAIASAFNQAWLNKHETNAMLVNYELPLNLSSFAVGQKTAAPDNHTAIFVIVSSQNASALLKHLKVIYPNQSIYTLPMAFNTNNLADLEGINFQIAPWWLHPQAILHAVRSLKLDDNNNSSIDPNLYAFGLDIAQLSDYYLQHNNFSDLALNANSGYLTLNSNNIIERTLMWASVKQGQLIIAPQKVNIPIQPEDTGLMS